MIVSHGKVLNSEFRFIFVPELAAASLLLQHGADASIKDHDGFSSTQLMIFDQGDVMKFIQRSFEEPENCFPVAIFAWGSNMNFTLGFGDDHERHVPDKLRVPFPSARCLLANPNVESGIACTNCGNANLQALRCIARGEIHLQTSFDGNDNLNEYSIEKIKDKRSTLETIVPRSLAEYRTHEKIPSPVVDVILRKFHTLFLTPDGVVFA